MRGRNVIRIDFREEETFNAVFSDGKERLPAQFKDVGISGRSAYEIAVAYGFVGTEEEWLKSLEGTNGHTPEKGVDYYTEAEKKAFVEELVDAVRESTLPAKIGVVTLPASEWVTDGNLHSQVVSIDGVTEYSQVDLTPSVEQLVIFYEKDLTFVTENDGGVVTVYAIGQRPTNDYIVQVTITEVIL